MQVYLTLLKGEEHKDKFAEIYNANHEKMQQIAANILQDKVEAENAIHEAFVCLTDAFEECMPLEKDEIDDLCISLAKNKSIDVFRRRRHSEEFPIENMVTFPNKPVCKNGF